MKVRIVGMGGVGAADGDYGDLAGAALLYEEIVPPIVAAAPEAVIVVATAPADPLVAVARRVFLWSLVKVGG
jgi:malate/lactate dehydrogenase